MSTPRLPRTAYFQRLGIDVWMRRRTRQARAATTATDAARPEQAPRPARRPSPAAATPPPQRKPAATSEPPSPAPEDAFRIRCFRYGRVFVAIAEDAWPRRRLLLDVARTLNRFQAAERRDVVFDWPQPGADPGGGERAFRAFFRHQTRAGVRAVLSGSRVLALLGHDRAAGSQLIDGHLYVAPQTPDAEAKQALWRLIGKLDAMP